MHYFHVVSDVKPIKWKTTSISYEQVKAELLRDPETRREYEELAHWYGEERARLELEADAERDADMIESFDTIEEFLETL